MDPLIPFTDFSIQCFHIRDLNPKIAYYKKKRLSHNNRGSFFFFPYCDKI
jgi:hypothetical protein